MKTYEFDVILSDIHHLNDDQVDALYSAGCNDGTPVSSCGVACVHFDREAASLEEAIRSAIAQVRSAGFQVSKIELDAGSAAFQAA